MSFESLVRWAPPALFAACCLLATFSGRRRVRGSTIVGPWCWVIAAFAVASFGSGYMALQSIPGSGGRDAFETLSFVMATFFFCPFVSVLGAKRPQHNAWHLIVASLWVVLILPAAESAFVNRGGSIQIHDARAWFLWALIVVTMLNYLFTRYVATVALSCAAMIVWLSPYLPGLRWELPHRIVWAAILFFAAVCSVVLCREWKSPARHRLDAVWIDFRDAFGITWGLRVMERVNTAAHLSESPARLEWDGFKVVDDITDDQDQALTASFDGIMRRFVDISEKTEDI